MGSVHLNKSSSPEHLCLSTTTSSLIFETANVPMTASNADDDGSNRGRSPSTIAPQSPTYLGARKGRFYVGRRSVPGELIHIGEVNLRRMFCENPNPEVPVHGYATLKYKRWEDKMLLTEANTPSDTQGMCFISTPFSRLLVQSR